MASGNSESSNCVNARVVLQQCISAKLMVKPPTDNEEAEYVQVRIIYICCFHLSASWIEIYGTNAERVIRCLSQLHNTVPPVRLGCG